jgi:tRNA(fMet)-specific endonuclease VapC
MTGSRAFLDSNIIIEVFSGNSSIADKIHQLSDFYISTIVLGELYVGINRVVNKDKHLKKLQAFLELANIIDIDQSTSVLFGEISAELYKKGKPIPTNDIWIAASIRQYNFTLITRDKHFNAISDLSIESW